MEWREFIASLVDSLAWPAALVILVALMRHHLGELLDSGGRLQRLKVGPAGAEIEWHALAAEVRAEVAAGPGSPRSSSPLDDTGVDLSELDGLAERSPADAIRVASAALIGELDRMVKERNAPLLAEPATPHILVKSAYHAGVITKETGEALRGLLTLKDLTEQRPETATVEKAVDFIVLSRAVLYALSRS